MNVNYTNSNKNIHNFNLSLYPSSCDFTEDVMQRYLEIANQISNSTQPFKYTLTKIGPNEYIVQMNVTQDSFTEVTFDVNLGFLTGLLTIPALSLPEDDNTILIIQSVISGIIGVSFFGTLALGATSSLWSLISYQQFVGYFIYLNIDYPNHVEIFLRCVQSSLWDYLPNPLGFLTEKISFDFLNPIEAEKEYNPPRKFIKYENTSFFIENGGSIILTNLILLVCLIFIQSILKIKKLNKIPVLKKLKSNMKWNIIIRTFLENAIPLCLSICLQIRILDFNQTYLSICSFLAILSSVYFFVMILFSFSILLTRKNKILKLNRIRERYGTLYEGISLKNPKTKYYNLILLSRGIVLMILISFAEEIIALQLVPLILVTMCLIYYLIQEVSFEDRKLDFIVKVSEIFVLCGEIGIVFFFPAETKSSEHYDNVGWVVVFFLASSFLIQFIYIIVLQVLGIKEIINQIRKIKNDIVSFFKSSSNQKKNKVTQIAPSARLSLTNELSTEELFQDVTRRVKVRRF